jgi:hypothetical protein
MATTLQSRNLDAIVPRSAVERLRIFRRDAEQALGDRVKEVILFGSRARGNARRNSDYDVAVVVNDLVDRRATDNLLSDIAYPHIVAGVHIVPVSVPSNFLSSDSPDGLAASIRRDGIVVR